MIVNSVVTVIGTRSLKSLETGVPGISNIEAQAILAPENGVTRGPAAMVWAVAVLGGGREHNSYHQFCSRSALTRGDMNALS